MSAVAAPMSDTGGVEWSGLDANGSWSLVLATEGHFLERRTEDGRIDPRGPALEPGVAYSPDRHVLDLLPVAGTRRNRRLPPRVIEVTGDSYLVDRNRLLVERCDGSTAPVAVDPHELRDPGGLALDRRGLLYVADRRRRAVSVIHPGDGSVEARLVDPEMREPVDVAVAPNGAIFVADRGGGDLLGAASGRIFVFDARFQPLRSFAPRNDAAPPRPRRCRPIAVFVAPGGQDVVVADEFHPRLLVFTAAGDPIGERELGDLAAAARREFDPGAALGVEGFRVALARAVGLCGCPPDLDLGHALATSHRLLRLDGLSLAARFRTSGRWRSAILDSGVSGTQWHRIALDVDLPDRTRIRVAAATADDPADLEAVAGVHLVPADEASGAGLPTWHVIVDRERRPIAFRGAPPPPDPPPLGYDIHATSSTVREQLLHVPPGRFLRLRVDLLGDGTATPSLRSIEIVVPRHSYRTLLPEVFSQNPSAERFLDGYLALFERQLTSIEATRDDFYRRLSPLAAPPEVLTWLAALLDLTFDPSWPLPRRRRLVVEAMELYRRRGTPAGLRRYIEVYTGITPVITEDYLERPTVPTYAGTSGTLGRDVALGVPGEASPDETLFAAYAHRFTVHLPLLDPCDRDVVVPVVDRIIDVNKPAHTEHRLRIVDADARLDDDRAIGVDLVLGARSTARTQLGPQRPVLGQDTVLGPDRPYPRPPNETL